MPIKPESITQQQAEQFAELMDVDFGRFLHDYQAIPVDKIANALIEAGIVSPPVWVARSTVSGKLLNLTCRKSTKPNTGELIEYEHWKGQTE
jgi:hypothetical protein